jgi:SAM-dependent methyltransferase
MTAAAAQARPLWLDGLVERDGIYHRAHEKEASDYRRRWEDEAAENHVRSAIAGGGTHAIDYETLTGKISEVWSRFPEGRDFEAVLEIGCGYGRIPLYLARKRGFTWSEYYAVDISETMLRRFLEYHHRFAIAAPAARVHALCLSADELPLDDDSVDLALTSAVFLHMGKSFVARAVGEIARTLRPGGDFVFDVSFPNAHNPANLPPRLKPRRLRPPNFMKYWSRAEITRLLEESGLAEKAGGFVIEPGAYALLPKRVGPVAVPAARRINRAAERLPAGLERFTASTYTVHSAGLLR